MNRYKIVVAVTLEAEDEESAKDQVTEAVGEAGEVSFERTEQLEPVSEEEPKA